MLIYNDSSKPKGTRRGYMGHVTAITLSLINAGSNTPSVDSSAERPKRPCPMRECPGASLTGLGMRTCVTSVLKFCSEGRARSLSGKEADDVDGDSRTPHVKSLSWQRQVKLQGE